MGGGGSVRCCSAVLGSYGPDSSELPGEEAIASKICCVCSIYEAEQG